MSGKPRSAMQMPKSVQPAAVGRNGPPSRKASGSKRCGASANIVCGKLAGFAKLISRETGKPLWEARTEVEAAIKKVEISAEAYFERAPSRKKESALSEQNAVRHKPYGVLAVVTRH